MDMTDRDTSPGKAKHRRPSGETGDSPTDAGDVVSLGRYDGDTEAITELRQATGRNTPTGVWLRGRDPRTVTDKVTLGDVFDTDFEYLNGLVDGRERASSPGAAYHDYDSFLFGPESGRHPRHSLISRDD